MRPFNFLIIFVSSFLLSACCQVHSETEPRIWMTFESDRQMHKILHIKTEKHDFNAVVDTIWLINNLSYSYPNDLNFKTRVMPIFTGDFNHIIVSYNFTRFDTITNVSYTRSECNRLEEVAYFWNGEYSNDASLEIHQ